MRKYTIIAENHETHQGRFKSSRKKEYTEKTKREYIGIVKFVEMDFGR